MPSRRAIFACLLIVASAAIAYANPNAGQQIVVRNGDSLWTLARAHGTTVAELMAANDLTSERLAAGQVLVLPGSEPGMAYTVQPNDTLYDLARRHRVSVEAIQAANALNTTVIRPGMALTIPGVAAAAASQEPQPGTVPETPPVEAAATEPQVEAAAVEPLVVTVGNGDNLWSIARAHGVSVAAIASANGIDAETTLRIGQTLTIPGTSAPAVAAVEQPAVDDGSSAVGATPAEATVEREAPAAVEAVADPAAPAMVEYAVRPADTLYDIARAHGVSVDDLIAWNRLDGTLIRVGQVLALAPGNDLPAPQPLVVTVRNGDNLWTLARTHDTTVAAIAGANHLDPQATLRLGQTLTIPGRYAAVAGADGRAPAVGGAAASTIRVGPGESLWTIAQRHGTTVGALMELNALSSDRLQVGQALRVLPGGAPTQALPAAAAPMASVPSSGMVWPLVGQITSRFGYRRLRIGGTNMHYGLDIDGNTGDPIRSATAGTVTFAGWRGGFGYLVIVENGDTEYYYAHASALLASVGQRVQPGDLIARVGATGNVTGPHLHFEIRVSGTPVDPLPILEARATR